MEGYIIVNFLPLLVDCDSDTEKQKCCFIPSKTSKKLDLRFKRGTQLLSFGKWICNGKMKTSRIQSDPQNQNNCVLVSPVCLFWFEPVPLYYGLSWFGYHVLPVLGFGCSRAVFTCNQNTKSFLICQIVSYKCFRASLLCFRYVHSGI